jgi:hypothetical protein
LIAPDLCEVWRKNSAINSALPSLVARPLFFGSLAQTDMLVREFVAGNTLHQLLELQQLSPQKAAAHAQMALHLIEETSETSTIAAAHAEAAAVMNAVELLPPFRPIDRAFIRELLAPYIFEQISLSSPQTRWTNCDFTPHNLILTPSGNVRLIDYEFAQRTHFPDDVWRWDNLGITRNAPKLTQPGQYPAWMEIFFWCRQLVFSHQTASAAIAAADAPHAIGKILSLFETTAHAQTWQSKGIFLSHFSLAASSLEKISRLTASEAALTDKVARMQSSFSWRCTGWLRAIRRFFT